MPARAMARLLWELPKPKMIGCRSSRMIPTAFVTCRMSWSTTMVWEAAWTRRVCVSRYIKTDAHRKVGPCKYQLPMVFGGN